MLEAMIVTLLTMGKIPNRPQNFQPIFLLNNDIKIYAKLIALQLMDIIHILFHPDQSGFTKGRQSSDTTRRVINIIHLANQSRTPSLLLALDAEKAFDRIHWGYLSRVLLNLASWVISCPPS